MTLESRLEALERMTPANSKETIIVFVNEHDIEIHSGLDVVTFPRDGMTTEDINEEIKERFGDNTNTVCFFAPDGKN